MNVSVEILSGAIVTGIFWGHISALFLSALKASAKPHHAFIISSLGFAWGYLLHHRTKKMPFALKHKRVFVGWLFPVILGGISKVAYLAGTSTLPVTPAITAGTLYHLLLWALCSVLGINRARATNLLPVQRDSLMGTLVLSVLAVFLPANQAKLAEGALLFALVSSVNIAVRRDRTVFEKASRYERRHRMLGVLTFLALTLTLAILTAAGGPGILSWMWKYVKVAYHLVGTLIIYATLPFAWVAHWLIMALKHFMNQEPFSEDGFEFVLERPLERLEERVKGPEPPPWIYPIFVALIVLGLLWLIWRFLLKNETHERDNSAHIETRVNLVGSGAVKDWAQNSAQEIASHMRRNLERFLRSLGRNQPKTVEELYSHSIALMGRRTFPRKASETPYEYLRDVSKHMSSEDGCKAFDYITQLFCCCYYGNRRPEPSEWEKGIDAYWILNKPETFLQESQPIM